MRPQTGRENLRLKLSRQHGGRTIRGLFACFLVLTVPAGFAGAGPAAWGQTAPVSSTPSSLAQPEVPANWAGRQIRQITIEGLAPRRIASLHEQLPLTEGTPFDPEKLTASLRQLYATGVFDTLEVSGREDGDGINIVFRGTPREFIGTVSVDGAKGATVNTQLQQATRLMAGTRFTETKMATALEQMRQVLADNGYYQPTITPLLTRHPEEQLVDIAYHVNSGVQARIGEVKVTGDSGLSLEEFRRHARMRPGAAVDHDTVNRALAGLLKYYRSQDRLEAEIKLETKIYSAHHVDFGFTANQGPTVKVVAEGAPLSRDRIRRLVPVFEEGSVDDDLLNEGNRRVRDYFQSLGYFDVKVDHTTRDPQPGHVLIAYNVKLGPRRHVQKVSVEGNHYFASSTLQELLSVHAATAFDRHGIFSQALVTTDVNALESVYQNNGFSKVKVTPETNVGEAPMGAAAQGIDPSAPLTVVYHIDEGLQQRVGAVTLQGNEHVEAQNLMSLLNTIPGQLLSPRNLAGDRDALVTEYMSRGFDLPHVEVEEKPETNDASKMDVVFHITEGRQFFVRNVLLSGLHYTRPTTVTNAITLHPGDPLSESELQQTQRNMYEFALFNEVNAAVQNPGGAETNKTVLLQAVEARRWTLTYGAGFEVQTGTPVNGCQGAQARGQACNPEGRTGISPRGLMAITRNNLFGREQSASIQGNYGLLEQKVNLIYQNPHVFGYRNLGLTFTGGYANSLDVTTYVASQLEAGFRFTENFNRQNALLSRANTFIYGFDFRRVKVAENTLQVFPQIIPDLAAAVRVAGPSFTWIRDTRDSAVDAHRGTYTSFQEFLSAAPFGAEAHFNRIDTSNSSFYQFDTGKFVLARNTRYGQERAFGEGSSELLPLPERLYAGGATSMRGFSINAAGPRDPDTGFPIGGAGALVNSTELRLPPPTLPYFGNTLSFVLFHDMGNVFTNAGDAWESIFRVQQPNRSACKTLTPAVTNAKGQLEEPLPGGATTSTGPQGTCSFNYFSHAPGLGLRYHTPVGPIRLDFSYNLNPPIYPVNVDYSLSNPYSNQHVGEADHFNFFFSLGQTF